MTHVALAAQPKAKISQKAKISNNAWALSRSSIAGPAPWDGFYIGAAVGGAFGSSKGDYTGEGEPPPPPPPPALIYYPFDMKPASPVLSGIFGYNHRHRNFLFGAEGDLGLFLDASDRVFDPAGSGRYDQIDLFWLAHARGRVGYLFDRYLFYVAGGVAFTGTRNWHHALNTLYSDGRIRVGYTLGGGIEAALNERWRVRAEYLYDHFKNERFDWTATRYSNSDLTLDIFRLAAIYRFPR